MVRLSVGWNIHGCLRSGNDQGGVGRGDENTSRKGDVRLEAATTSDILNLFVQGNITFFRLKADNFEK